MSEEMTIEFIKANDEMVVLSQHNRIVASLNEDLNAAYAAQSELQQELEQERRKVKQIADLYVEATKALTERNDALAEWAMQQMKGKSNDR